MGYQSLENKMEKQKKQLWINIEKHIRRFYPDEYNDEDIRISKAFFKAGFNVYPESGFMFQKITSYSDGSYNKACVEIEEARLIFKELNSKAEETCATKHVIPPKSKDSGILPNFT